MKETIASGLSREGLRRIAACTMLVDHIGATLFPGVLWLRCVGRLAFPIFAFFSGGGLPVHTQPAAVPFAPGAVRPPV